MTDRGVQLKGREDVHSDATCQLADHTTTPPDIAGVFPRYRSQLLPHHQLAGTTPIVEAEVFFS